MHYYNGLVRDQSNESNVSYTVIINYFYLGSTQRPQVKVGAPLYKEQRGPAPESSQSPMLRIFKTLTNIDKFCTWKPLNLLKVKSLTSTCFRVLSSSDQQSHPKFVGTKALSHPTIKSYACEAMVLTCIHT